MDKKRILNSLGIYERYNEYTIVEKEDEYEVYRIMTGDIEGCVLVGYNYKDLDGDGLHDVTDSRAFLNKMLTLLPENEKFILRIEDDNPLIINKK
ncbi:MAG TPA: hypothetical protein VK031_00130 [Tissierellaceae bacterium]|nr:hypothetical protein [Tissierellaceae bacterium]